MTETAKIDLLAPEISASPIGSIFEVADERIGRERVDEWLAEWHVDLRSLHKTHAWVSLALVEKLLDALSREGGPELVERAGRLSISPKHLGPIYPLFRALASPLGTYDRMRSDMPRYNKAHEILFDESRPGYVRARMRLVGAARPETFHFCHLIEGQLTSVPTLFEHPPSTVTQSKCMGRGDEDCVFEIRWQERARRLPPWVPALAGAGAAVGGSLWLGAEWPLVASFGTVSAVAGWAIGFLLDQRRAVDGLVREFHDHHEALAKSLRGNEQRYEELLAAKRDVDLQVEQRTQQLSVALAEVRALDEAKTSFFANVSHDLRTPLTMIIGPLEELLHGNEPPGGTKNAIEAMHRNAMRLIRLINQLLDLAKVDAGGTKLTRVSADPSALARNVAAPFEAAARARKITLSVEAETTAPVVVDVGWVESALSNLLGNAMRFARDAGHVTLRVSDRGHEVAFVVEDDGLGIAAEDLPRLFDRFSQGADDAVRAGGTGIGLAIVREAARLHGGEVGVESEPGKGARFTLRIPRSVGEDADVRISQAGAVVPAAVVRPSAAVDLMAPIAEAIRRDGPSPTAPLALVAEDHDDIRTFVADVLAVQYRVIAVSDGVEALKAAREELPAIIVSDLSMPRMDGLELARTLRSDPRTRQIPFVLLTAHRDVSQVLAGFEAGADDYVAKPFHARELLARIDVRVRLNELAREMAHRERLAALGVLAASVAHQVRNPLTSICVGLPALRMKLDSKLDSRGKELMDAMIDGAARIERLTTDLLDISRVDREVEGPCRPADGLHSALRLMGARLPEGVTIQTDIDDDVQTIARAGDLNQVYLNLLDNAVRAVGDAGTVRVECHRDGGMVRVSIGDSGPGLPPGIAARVFEPFVTTRPAGVGTGLGLSIAKQVIDRHGGTITTGTSPLGGALFVVSIPIRVPAARVDSPVATAIIS